MNTDLRFRNGSFKIMQIADIQENSVVNPDTIKLIDLALEREMPDLVVLTGDQIQGYSSCYLKNAQRKVEKVIADFLEPVTRRGIPFCFTYGNHDDDCGVSKEIQTEMYKGHKGCVYGVPASEDDTGTYMIKIKDSEGKEDVLGIYLFDTGTTSNGIKEAQLQWYRNERDTHKEKTGSYLPAIVFQHIPVPEFYNIIEKTGFFSKGRVEAYKGRKNTFWRLDEDTLARGGFMGESPGVPDKNSGQFDVLKEKGDVFALYAGHDHVNSFYKNYEGIDLGYCQGASFHTYGPYDKRGVRMFVFDENDVRGYKTYTVTMGELCRYKPAKPVNEFVYRYAPTCPEEVFTNLSRVAVVAGAVGTAVKIAKHITKK